MTTSAHPTAARANSASAARLDTMGTITLGGSSTGGSSFMPDDPPGISFDCDSSVLVDGVPGVAASVPSELSAAGAGIWLPASAGVGCVDG